MSTKTTLITRIHHEIAVDEKIQKSEIIIYYNKTKFNGNIQTSPGIFRI